MSVFVAEDTDTTFCGDARLVAGSISSSPVKACPGSTLRIYNCVLASASLDGTFELDDTKVENVRLGVSDSTRIVAFDSRVTSSRVC